MVQHTQTHTHRSLIASVGHIQLSTTHTPLSRQTHRHAAHKRARGFLFFLDTASESGERSQGEETNKRIRDKVREECEAKTALSSVLRRDEGNVKILPSAFYGLLHTNIHHSLCSKSVKACQAVSFSLQSSCHLGKAWLDKFYFNNSDLLWE